MKTKLFFLLIFITGIVFSQKPVHFKIADTTAKSNAVISLEYSINPNVNGVLLKSGDEVGVYNSQKYCCGAVMWMEKTTAIIAYGNDGIKKIGFEPGNVFNFRIWQKSSAKEYDARAKFKSGDGLSAGLYTPNGISRLDSLTGYKIVKVENPIYYSMEKFDLFQNYPNPFNPNTKITYSIPETGNVCIEIIDINGNLITNLINKIEYPGFHVVEWDGRNKGRDLAATGIYFYRLVIDNIVIQTKKMIFTK